MTKKITFIEKCEADKHTSEKIEQESNTEKRGEGVPKKYILCLEKYLYGEASLFKQQLLYIAVWMMSKDNLKILKLLLAEEVSIVAWSLNELHPTNVPFTNDYKITDNTPVYPPLHIKTTKHNDKVRKTIEALLSARNIKLATSPWVLPGLIAKKNVGSLIFL